MSENFLRITYTDRFDELRIFHGVLIDCDENSYVFRTERRDRRIPKSKIISMLGSERKFVEVVS